MEVIKRVLVKNFRSIVREEFEPQELTVFVGKNDSGKSNFLRSLNLFFNDQTDVGQPINFDTDFSTLARVGRGKAKQIEIWLDIQPPPSFSDRSIVRWRRAWREGGATFSWQDITKRKDGSKVSAKSKVIPWLNRIRFRYVPAIKGADYFASLLRDMHDVLAETVDAELRGASGTFIDAIREHTGQISELTQAALGIDSRLQLPTNLRALFEVLDFETSYGSAAQSLRQRGDGVKVRHISSILKYLADQERRLVGSGRSKPAIVWGYEEPENNLELSQAFEHASELREFSRDIQIMLTTHSPAFYSLVGGDEGVAGYSVQPSSSGTSLQPLSSAEMDSLNESLGLMTLVAPYIREKAELVAQISSQAEDLTRRLQEREVLVVLVAGQTDAQYLRSAINALMAGRSDELVISHVGAVGAGGSQGAGDQNLMRFAREVVNQSRLVHNRVLVLLDCDVGAVPDDATAVLYRRIPCDLENHVFRRGIENLLPPAVALPEFYDTSEKTDDYGARSTISKINKQRLCDAVCDPEASLPLSFAERMRAFEPVVALVREALDG